MELEVSAKASNVSNVSSLMVKELKGNKMMVVPEEIPEPTGSSMKGPESGEGGLKNKMTAASALADLTSVSSPVDDEDDEDDDEGSIDSNLEEGKGELQLPVRFYKNGRKRAVPFVLKLMKVLSCKEYAHIIAWTPSGLTFDILKPRAFTKEVLPVHFKTAKYSSFIRKLHRWGFAKHYRDHREETGTFCHKNFQSGRLDLAETMRPSARNLPQSKSHPKAGQVSKKAKGPLDTTSTPGKLGEMMRPSMMAPSIIHPAASSVPYPAGIGGSAWSPRNQHQYSSFGMGNSNNMANLRVDMELQRLLAERDNASAWPPMQAPRQVDYSAQFGSAASSDPGIASEVDRRIKERFDEAVMKNRALTGSQQHMFQQQGYNSQKNTSTDLNAAIEAEVDRRLKSHLQGNMPSYPRQQQQSNPFAFSGMNSMSLTPLQQCLQSQSRTQDSMMPPMPFQQQHHHHQVNPDHVGAANNPYQQQDGSAMSAMAARRYELLLSMFPLSPP